MPKKPLITEKHVREAAKAGTALSIAPGALVTPLARDTARELGVEITTASRSDLPGTHPAVQRPATKVIAFGSDHGGFQYKNELKPLVEKLGWKVVDVGTDSEKSCDYPDFAYAVAKLVHDDKADFGVMIDGAGIGSAMVCNKVSGIRAACAYNEFTAWNARAHNNANVLTLGSRTLGIEVCKRIVETFLKTDFEGGRHEGRVQKVSDVEARFLPGKP